MSEEVKIKISQPMFEIGELERFDNNIHSIVEEYSKLMLKEKDQILTQRIIMKQEEEIERLRKYEKFINNVIITPVDWNNENGNYQLHNMSKQDLYKELFDLRHQLHHEMYDSKVYGSDKE